MSEGESYVISADDFARRIALRSSKLMWLLGAGASAAAGVPTAEDMIWEFRRQLYISQRRVDPATVADLSSPAIRETLERYITQAENLPPIGSPDEYASLFEAVFPAEQDRRTYIAAKIAGGKPSYGHIAIATLMQAEMARIVWTTNVDALIADACAKVFGSTAVLTSAALDAPSLAAQCIEEESWPLEVKLHGDFRSRRLKNTDDELREQDAQLRQLLIGACGRYGLIVAGYSGRDGSVMATLAESVRPGAFPAGLFWLHRGVGLPSSHIMDFVVSARQAGCEASVVRINNFDEVLRDVVHLVDLKDAKVLDSFASGRQVVSDAPRPSGRRAWPVIRLNAIEVSVVPSVCRRVVCDIGGYSEVREAVAAAGVDILFARTRAGVLAFGPDSDIREAFRERSISEFDLYTIHSERLRYESGEQGLLRSALTRAIARNRPLEAITRRRRDLLIPVNPEDEYWAILRRIVGPISGEVPRHPTITWREGIAVRLDWADDRLWLLIEPRTVFDDMSPEQRGIAADFARERSVKRYNRALNDLLMFWENVLVEGGEDLRAYHDSVGVQSRFQLSSGTAFSRRIQV